MKKLLLVIFLFILFSDKSFSQKISPTTEDEYNYATVGYKIQLQTKLPMKRGYRIQDFGIYEDPDRTVGFKGLFRDGESQPCAMIMIYTRKDTPPEYFCMPTSDASEYLWSRYYKTLNVISDNPVQQLQFMSYGLSKTIMRISSASAE